MPPSTAPSSPGAPQSQPRHSLRPFDRPQGSTSITSSNTSGSVDLSVASTPDCRRQPQPCICSLILETCHCSEMTRTKGGVCDMCLYSIHVTEKGQMFGGGCSQGARIVSKVEWRKNKGVSLAVAGIEQVSERRVDDPGGNPGISGSQGSAQGERQGQRFPGTALLHPDYR